MSISYRRNLRTPHLLGVDPGTKTIGWCLMEIESQDIKSVGVWDLSRAGDYIARFRLFQATWNGWQYRNSFDILAIEDQFIGANAHTAMQIARAQTWVIAEALRANVDAVLALHPTTLKNEFAGDQKADKKMMIATARRVYPRLREIESKLREHAADAIAAAWVGAAHYQLEQRLKGQ